ncbi:MAG: hypothetical protein ACKPBA_05275 [Planctomycetota bacterium]
MTKTPLRRGRLLAGLLLCAQALAGCLSGAGPEVPTITEQPKDRIGFVGRPCASTSASRANRP